MTTLHSSEEAVADRPEVTVVIAAYNAAGFLEKATNSALSQGVSLEVLVVDDASADATPTVMAEMARADHRIVPVYCKANTGPSGARNQALTRARGRWIAVLDSDDLFRPERLQDMIDAALSTDADIVIDDFASVDGEGTLLDQANLAQLRPSGVLSLQDWLALNSFVKGEISFGYAKPMISSEFLRRTGVRYNESLRNGEDFHLILEALIAGAKMQFIAKTGYLYTRRAGSVSQRAKLDHLRALLDADQKIVAQLGPDMPSGIEQLWKERCKNLTSLLITEETFDRLKSGRVFGALMHLFRHPSAIGRFLSHLREAVLNRLPKAQ